MELRQMTWYTTLSKLIKIAGPKEKIQQFKVIDPALQMFIMRFEGMIKWGGYTIENEETGEDTAKKIDPKNGEKDINEFISTQILPRVYAKTDPENPNNNYMKKFDVEKEYTFAKENHIYDPELEQAYNISQRNKEEGENFYLKIINGKKKQTFDEWTNYVQQHPDYNKSPSFIYMLLNPIFDSSDAKTKKPPVSASPAVIAKMHQRISGVRYKYDGAIKDEKVFKQVLALHKEKKTPEEISQSTGVSVADVQTAINQNDSKNMDILKTYDKDLADYSLEASRQEFDGKGHKSGWIKLPRKDKTQPRVDEKGNKLSAEDVYKENLETLHNFSVPNSWCTTKNSNGPIYLSAGDFWILVKEGKGVVGIRFDGENIAEIAGDQSFNGMVSRSCPREYWREITDIVTREGLEDKITGYSAKAHWEEILKERNLNKSFFNDDGTPNLEEIEDFKTHLLANPALFNRVTENDKFQQYPEIMEQLKDTCKQGWFKKVQDMQGNDALQMAQNVADNAQNMPDFVLADPAFIENVHGRLTALYANNPESVKQVLDKVPNHWQVYPRGKEVFKQAILGKYREGLYWRAEAYGASSKTKEQRNRINVAKIALEQLQAAIGKYMPELNEDRGFEADLELVKRESAAIAINEGYFSVGMPRQAVEQFFLDPANIEKLSTEYAERISKAHETPYKRQTKTTVFLDAFMNKDINSIAPGWIRKLPGFQQLSAMTKKKVLTLSINDEDLEVDKFTLFEDHYKNDPELRALYKEKVLRNNPYQTHLMRGPQYFDPHILEDPDFQQAINADDLNVINKDIYTVKLDPLKYFRLSDQKKQNPDIIQAYIAGRITTKSLMSSIKLVNEYPMLPQFLKEEPIVMDKYKEMLIHLIRVAKPGNPNFLHKEKIVPPFDQDPDIIREMNTRDQQINLKKASIGWYKKLGQFA